MPVEATAATGRGTLIDGIAVAKRIRARVAEQVRALVARGTVPGLHVVLVGDDPASAAYVMSKGKASAEAGIAGGTTRMPASTPEAELLSVVGKLNADPSVHGILVQMPLPKQINPDTVIRCIDPRKDVDGFHPVNVGRLLIGDPDAFPPCTPFGIMWLLREYKVKTAGANVVIIGRSNIVGKPMAALLMQPGVDATVTVCHSKTRDLAGHTRRADIVIAAVGRPGTLTGDMVMPGAVVVDVGINRVDDKRAAKGYRLVGDVDFESVRPVASLITPVPGGVGPMTIAMLLHNTVRSAERLASG